MATPRLTTSIRRLPSSISSQSLIPASARPAPTRTYASSPFTQQPSSRSNVEQLPRQPRPSAEVKAAFAKKFGLDDISPQKLNNALHHAPTPDGQLLYPDHTRMEFLGKQILSYCATNYIHATQPRLSADAAENLADSLTGRTNLHRVAENLGIRNVMAFGETKQAESAIARRVLTALFGALYLEKGPSAAQSFFKQHFVTETPDVDLHAKLSYPKTLLARISDTKNLSRPVARLINAPLPKFEHLTNNPVYIVGMYNGDELIARGFGLTSELAESRAAKAVIDKIFMAEVPGVELGEDASEQEADISFFEDNVQRA
ncbi:hypothetical protein HDV00_002368 [Rhizophlyctis rosea]|nr:hypothetical protein HDV00_002368 [Rhizophlyctis rosea]